MPHVPYDSVDCACPDSGLQFHAEKCGKTEASDKRCEGYDSKNHHSRIWRGLDWGEMKSQWS